MKLSAAWTDVATRRNATAPWAWKLDALERIVLSKMIDEGKADQRYDRRPGGLQAWQARDRGAALLARMHLIPPPEPVIETPAAEVETVAAAPTAPALPMLTANWWQVAAKEKLGDYWKSTNPPEDDAELARQDDAGVVERKTARLPDGTYGLFVRLRGLKRPPVVIAAAPSETGIPVSVAQPMPISEPPARRTWRVPVERLPPAKPIGMATYMPAWCDPARWVPRPVTVQGGDSTDAASARP